MWRNSTFIAVIHITVTVGSSKISITHKLYPKRSVKRLPACHWAAVFNSVDKRYIWVSLSCWYYLVFRNFFQDAELSTRNQIMDVVILQILSSLCLPHTTSHYVFIGFTKIRQSFIYSHFISWLCKYEERKN